jgi:hypothetical protein
MKPQIKQPGKKLSDVRLAEVERKFKIRLPDAYRAFLLKHNGGVPEPDGVCWKGKKEPAEVCRRFFSIDSGRDFDDWVKQFERMKDEDEPILPLRLVPIASDPFGNFFCLSVLGKDAGKIYFWHHEEAYKGKPRRDVPDDGVFLMADSFEKFLDQFAESEDDEEDEEERELLKPRKWDALIEAGDRAGMAKWLDAGGKLEEHNRQGQIPLSLAIEQDQEAIVDLLLDRGANLEQALDFAIGACRWNVLRLVLKKTRGKKLGIRPSLFASLLEDCDDVSLVEAMLDAGAPLHGEHGGCNPLHFATIHTANPQIVKLLLDRGARLEQSAEPSVAHKSALANAICIGNLETVKLLLDAGADLYAHPGKTRWELRMEKDLEEMKKNPGRKTSPGEEMENFFREKQNQAKSGSAQEKAYGSLAGMLQRVMKNTEASQLLARVRPASVDDIKAAIERERRVNGAKPAVEYLDAPRKKKLPASFKEEVIAYAAKLGQKPKKNC